MAKERQDRKRKKAAGNKKVVYERKKDKGKQKRK
jgi:hypothetical protein